MTPAEILDRMFADNERRVAHVDNYTVVQTTSSVPMPVVFYYEKEIIEGRSTFQLVSPAELANRQAAANGQPTAEQMGQGVAAVAGALGGLLGGGAAESPGGGSEDGEAGQGGTQSSATGDGGAGNGGGSGGGLLGQFVDRIRDLGEGLREGRGRFEEQQGVADDLFWNEDFVARMRNQGEREVLIDGTFYSCDELLYQRSVDGELAVIDLGLGSEEYAVTFARMFVSKDEEGFIEPIAMHLEILHTTSGEYINFERTHKDFRRDTPDGPIVPRRTNLTIDGIGGLIQGALDDVWTELQSISNVLVNNGPPTTEESAALIEDAINRLGLN